MHIDRGAFDERLIPFLRVFAGRISEESGTESLPNLCGVPSARDYAVMIPIHDAHELLPNILSTAHLPSLDEVLVAPGVAVA